MSRPRRLFFSFLGWALFTCIADIFLSILPEMSFKNKTDFFSVVWAPLL